MGCIGCMRAEARGAGHMRHTPSWSAIHPSKLPQQSATGDSPISHHSFPIWPRIENACDRCSNSPFLPNASSIKIIPREPGSARDGNFASTDALRRSTAATLSSYPDLRHRPASSRELRAPCVFDLSVRARRWVALRWGPAPSLPHQVFVCVMVPNT